MYGLCTSAFEKVRDTMASPRYVSTCDYRADFLVINFFFGSMFQCLLVCTLLEDNKDNTIRNSDNRQPRPCEITALIPDIAAMLCPVSINAEHHASFYSLDFSVSACSFSSRVAAAAAAATPLPHLGHRVTPAVDRAREFGRGGCRPLCTISVAV